ncbi:MAG: hypothetical protein EXQ83_11290 [Xanthobacteraceae bacterium]|nr:hypothetical protein [Xanthobacteraceae bacterium]
MVGESMLGLKRVLSAIAFLAMAGAGGGLPATAEPFFQGEQKCVDCHKSEDTVWKATKHSTSFREIHRKPLVKDIITAAGGDANMRRNAVCTTCHFAMTQANATARPAATAGPTCENCHGPSSDWMPLHNDYGGPAAKRETETPAHKTERIQKSIQAGMIRPEMLYDIATNCLSCHGLSRPGVPPETIAKMIDAGHAAGSSFELVSYLEGTVRHRFYPPDVSKNSEMTNAEKSRVFITGHAAALVKGASVAGAVTNLKYVETQKKIETSARAALDAIKGQVPEAAALLAQPTDANARKLVDAISGKDLSAQVGSLMPAKGAYK